MQEKQPVRRRRVVAHVPTKVWRALARAASGSSSLSAWLTGVVERELAGKSPRRGRPPNRRVRQVVVLEEHLLETVWQVSDGKLSRWVEEACRRRLAQDHQDYDAAHDL